MSTHTDPQTIIQNGKPAFAVIPWSEYQKLILKQADDSDPDVWFPNEVVKANVRGETLVKAWREYFNLTQNELAEKAGMKQSALARIESGNSKPRKATLKKIAAAFGIELDQLID